MHLDRLITVLETVAISGRAFSPVDVQRATGLPRPTCYRLLQTLAKHRPPAAPEGASRNLSAERPKRIGLFGPPDADVCRTVAPIRSGNLGISFSVGATGRIRRFTSHHREKIGAGLIEVADQIVAKL